jgi:hypothetical protein
MNLTKKMILALGLLAAASAGVAQTAVTTTTNGVLGQQFAEVNFSFVEIDSISDYTYVPGLRVNVPVIASQLDVGGTYNYAKIRGPIKGHTNAFGVYATGYMPLENVKPFVSANLGYAWTSLPANAGDKGSNWAVNVGVEIPVGDFTITPSIGYGNEFDNSFNEGDTWTYRVEGNYWFSPRTAAYAAIAKSDEHRNPVDVWSYQLGYRFKF